MSFMDTMPSTLNLFFSFCWNLISFPVILVFIVILPGTLPYQLRNNPIKIYFPLGAVVKVPCLAGANHYNAAVYWMKDGQKLNHSHGKITQQGHLYIKRIQYNDQGLYICKPYTQSNYQSSSSTVLHVIVKVPVYFLVRPRPIYQRHANQSVTMPCIAVGDPPPAITWRKIGGNFPGKTKTLYDAGNLTIVQLSKEDQGQYECVAQNIVASVITTSLLIIEATSHSPPYNLTVRTTNSSARVCWLPAYDNGHPQHYVLWYKAVDSHDTRGWTTMRIVPDDALCMTLHDLPPNTHFQFTILSRNRLGEGLFSSPINAITKDSYDHYHNGDENVDDEGDDDNDGGGEAGDDDISSGKEMSQKPDYITKEESLHQSINRPPPPPQNISVLKTKDGLYISWLPPPIPVEHYLIQYRTKGVWVTLKDEVKLTYFTWPTPSFGASYHFRVISFSKDKLQSEPSPEVLLETGNPMLSGNDTQTKMFATLFGVVVLVLLLIGSTLTLVKSCGHKRQQSSIRYDSVKYFGPSQLEPALKTHQSTSLKSDLPSPPTPIPPERAGVEKQQQQHTHLIHHSSLMQLNDTQPQTDVDSLSDRCYVNCTNHDRKLILETPI